MPGNTMAAPCIAKSFSQKTLVIFQNQPEIIVIDFYDKPDA